MIWQELTLRDQGIKGTHKQHKRRNALPVCTHRSTTILHTTRNGRGVIGRLYAPQKGRK
jgi:hypothetical protein